MQGHVIAMGLLALAGAGLLIWERLRPQAGGRPAQAVTMLAAAGAIAALLGLEGRVTPQTVALAQDGLARLSGALFLGAALLELCYQPPAAERTRLRFTLKLWGWAGAVLAIVSQDLGLTWLGLSLYLLAAQMASGCVPPTRGLLAPAVMGLGGAMVYMAGETLDQRLLMADLWLAGGQSRLLFAGLALMVAGVAISLGLLPPREEGGGPPVASALLGIGVLARLGVFTLAPLPTVWSRLLQGIAWITLLYGTIRMLRSERWDRRLVYVGWVHKSLLLLALSVVGTRRGLAAFLATALAYLLGQTLLDRLTRGMGGEPGALAPGGGWLRDRSLHGAALLVALTSCMGMLFTLGFSGRIEMMAAAQDLGAWGGVAAVLLASVCGAVGYVPLILRLFARPEKETKGPEPLGYYGWLATVLSAAALVGLGLMRSPLTAWVAWIMAA